MSSKVAAISTAVLVSLLVSLGGCLDKETPTATPFAPQCVTRVCLADPNSADAKRTLDEHGLHQITQSAAPSTEHIEGDTAVWLYSEGGVEAPNANIIGYSFAQQRLLDISTSEDYHSTRPFVDEGRILFSQEPRSTAPDAGQPQYLALWTGPEGSWRRIPTGLDAEELPRGFDWPWATFTVQRSENDARDGMWAINVETGWKAPLGPFPRHRDSIEYTAWSTVTEGVAYFTVRNEATDTYRLVERVLPDGPDRTIDTGSVNYITYDACGRYVSWLANGEPRVAQVYDRSTGIILNITTASETATDVRVGGEWVVFNVAPKGTPALSRLEGYHVPSKTRHVLVERDPYDGLVTRADTDGQRVLVTFVRGSTYEHAGEADAYWMELPKI